MQLEIYNPQENGFLQSIDWNFKELKQEITKRSESYMNLVYTEDQIQEAKKDRANLNKLIKALEDKRKEIKKQVMAPYTDFETKEKELVGIINGAVSNIDTQVKGYEESLRQEKLEKVKEIYVKCIGDLDRTIPFEKIFKESWLNKGTTFKSIKEEISGIYDKVNKDLKTINLDSSPYVYEMKEEYLKDFDMTAAMMKKQELEETAKKKALFEEQKKREAEERERRLAEDAAKVEMAGRQAVEPVEAYETADVGYTALEPVEQWNRVTLRFTYKEEHKDQLNAIIGELQKFAKVEKLG